VKGKDKDARRCGYGMILCGDKGRSKLSSLVRMLVCCSALLWATSFILFNDDTLPSASSLSLLDSSAAADAASHDASALDAVASNRQEPHSFLNKLRDETVVFQGTYKGKTSYVSKNSGTYRDLMIVCGCMGMYDDDDEEGEEEDADPPPTIPSDETHMYMRRLYEEIMGVEQSTIPRITPASKPTDSGFHVPIYIDISKEMGRGIYAKQDIANGTHVWTGTYEARMFEGWQYRSFVMSVPKELQCNFLLHWSYTLKDEDSPHGSAMIVDLDYSYLWNSVGPKRLNTYQTDVEGSKDPVIYATRDIKAGEQLLMSYSDFLGSQMRGKKKPLGL